MYPSISKGQKNKASRGSVYDLMSYLPIKRYLAVAVKISSPTRVVARHNVSFHEFEYNIENTRQMNEVCTLFSNIIISHDLTRFFSL